MASRARLVSNWNPEHLNHATSCPCHEELNPNYAARNPNPLKKPPNPTAETLTLGRSPNPKEP